MLQILMMFLTFAFLPSIGSPGDIETWAVYDGRGFMHISGSSEDFRKIGELKHTLKKPFLYARKGRTAWLVDDPAIVAVVRAICVEPTELKSRRHSIERSRQEIEFEMQELDRQSARHEDASVNEEGDHERDEILKGIDRKMARVDRKMEQLDEIEHDLDREYDKWQEDVDHDVAKVIAKAIDDGLAEKVR